MLKLKEKLFSKQSNPLKEYYFDYASTTPPDFETIAEWERVTKKYYGNPSSFHKLGLESSMILKEASDNIGKYFSVDGENVYFCRNGTEANGTILNSFKKDNFFIISTIKEHSSILKNLYKYKNKYICKINNSGNIDLDFFNNLLKDLKNKINNDRVVFAYSPINHEIGIVENCKDIFCIFKSIFKNGIIFIDAVQAITRMNRMEFVPYGDIFSISSHKVYSPKGVGAIINCSNYNISGIIKGGKQQGGIFPGTENLSGISSFSKAFSLLNDSDINYLKHIHKEFISMLKKRKLLDDNNSKNNFSKNIIIETSPGSDRGIVNLIFPEIPDIEDFIIEASNNNIFFSRYASCSQSITRISKTVYHITGNFNYARKSIRISFGKKTKREEIFVLVDFIENYLKRRF